jgi:hypothetical protein
MTTEQLISLAVEYWRLARWLDHAQLPRGVVAQPRHALGKMEEILRNCEIEARSLDGHPFDPGLAVRVVDTLESGELPAGGVFIIETVSPQVLLRGNVIRSAEVVTIRGTKVEGE